MAADKEAVAMVYAMGIDRAADLLDRLGLAVTEIGDHLQDEGDRVYLGTTNDKDRLRDLAQEFFECRIMDNPEATE